MIPESDKNTIFFSSLFARHYAPVYEQIKEILEYNGIANGLLTNTSDYWCRDYMPIQVGVNLMYQPVYFPDYLRGDQKYRTNPGIVKPSLKVNLRKFDDDIILDGGNAVACGGDKVIMSEKVFYENYHMTKEEITNQLEMNLHCDEIIWMPWTADDITGHTDGLVRPVDETTVLIDVSEYDPEIADEIRLRLARHYNIIELDLPKRTKNSWAYINAIQVGGVIILPEFDPDSDSAALEMYESLFPAYAGRIYQVFVGDIIEKYGGGLNCLSWTLYRHL